MLSLKVLYQYQKERLTIFPWWMLPLFLYFHVFGFHQEINIINIMYFYVAIFFYRILDDLNCMDYDISQDKIRTYYNSKVFDHLRGWLFLLGIVLLIVLNLSLGIWGIVYLSSFTILSLLAYFLLRNNKWIQLISIFKYPMLLILIQLNYSQINYLWPLIIFITMLGFEILDILLQNKKIIIFEYVTLVSLLFIKQY